MRPVLSVVIVNYHSSAFLAGCLKSVYATVTERPLEVIVVDNGTADDAFHALRESYSEATFVMNEENRGFVAANNQGASMARGKYILLLNPDAELTRGAADGMIGYLRAHPECAVVGPQLIHSDGTPQTSHFRFPGPWSLFLEHVMPVRTAVLLESAAAGTPRVKSVDTIRGACMMLPLEALRSIGGMNPDLFMYSEETDLCFRLRRAGRDVVFLRANYPPRKAGLCVGIVMGGLKTRMVLHRLAGRRERYGYFSSLYGRLLPVAHGNEERSGASPVQTS